jgi:hypothetical protein
MPYAEKPKSAAYVLHMHIVRKLEHMLLCGDLSTPLFGGRTDVASVRGAAKAIAAQLLGGHDALR